MRADAKMKMRHAESNCEIAVHRSDLGRRRRRMELEGRALNDGTEDYIAPMVLEQIAKQGFQLLFVCGQIEDVESRAVDFNHSARPMF